MFLGQIARDLVGGEGSIEPGQGIVDTLNRSLVLVHDFARSLASRGSSEDDLPFCLFCVTACVTEVKFACCRPGFSRIPWREPLLGRAQATHEDLCEHRPRPTAGRLTATTTHETCPSFPASMRFALPDHVVGHDVPE
jgi:hypothetical protein